MTDILVRLAGKADVEWCVKTATLDSNRFAEQISGINEVIVAELQGELVGMLHLCFLWPGHDGGTAFISLIKVLCEHQRKGVGKAMLAFVDADLRRRGHRILLSSCVVDEYQPQTWHRHMGFSECGFLAGFPFEDDLGELFLFKEIAPIR